MSAADPTSQEGVTPAATAGPMSTEQSIEQLRVIICILGAGLLILMLAFAAFVWKQNRNLNAQTNIRLQQTAQMRQVQARWVPTLNELAVYSRTKPELMAIFAKHGIEITVPATQPTTPVQPAPLPPQQ